MSSANLNNDAELLFGPLVRAKHVLRASTSGRPIGTMLRRTRGVSETWFRQWKLSSAVVTSRSIGTPAGHGTFCPPNPAAKSRRSACSPLSVFSIKTAQEAHRASRLHTLSCQIGHHPILGKLVFSFRARGLFARVVRSNAHVPIKLPSHK